MLYYVSQNVYGTKKLSDLFVCLFLFLPSGNGTVECATETGEGA